jgi:hypothetical protein
LARYAVTARPDNSDVIANWESKWHAAADQAMAGLATIFNDAPTPTDPADVLTKVKQFYIQFRASYTVDS